MTKPARFPFPAAEVGIPNFPVPSSGYILLIEKVDTEKGNYTPLDPTQSVLYEGDDAGNYPPLYLASQHATEQGKWIMRYWSTDRDAKIQNLWNYRREAMGDDSTFPLFVRELTIPRDSFLPTQAGTTLQSLLGITVTNKGSHYTHATATIEGSDAKAVCNVTNGQVDSIYLTDPGSSLTSPIVTIEGDGSGATAQAIFQPLDAQLVKEIRADLPNEDPLRGRYIKVTQIYMTLPGPWLYTEKVDPEDGAITISRRRLNVKDDIEEGEATDGNVYTVTNSIPYEESSFVSWELNDSMDLSTGKTLREIVPDVELDVSITTERKRKMISDITPGSFIGYDESENPVLFVIAQKDINQFVAWEITKIIPQPAANSVETAVLGTEGISANFPPRPVVGSNKIWTPQSEVAQATKRRWWVISETRPDIQIDTITLMPSFIGSNFVNASLSQFSTPTFLEYVGGALTTASYTTYPPGSAGGTGTANGVGSRFLTDFVVGGSVVCGMSIDGNFLGLTYGTITSITSDTLLEFTLPAVGASNLGYLEHTTTYGSIDPSVPGWIGQEKIRHAVVADKMYQKLWQIETLSIIMR